MRGRRSKAVAAGTSAERIFRRKRRENIRDQWRLWVGLIGFVVACTAASFLVSGYMAPRLYALAAGCLIGIGMTLWMLGGHVTTVFWRIGAEGERDTQKVIDTLGSDWHCEHDLEHSHGNFDHVLVGPPGVYLLDTKWLSQPAEVDGDTLRSGRLAYAGRSFRGGAVGVRQALEAQLNTPAPWVQAVVVIWGDFAQGVHEERDVVYVDGSRLRDWLLSQRPRVNAPARAALAVALAEARTVLGASVRGLSAS
jgi:hypothetical protein